LGSAMPPGHEHPLGRDGWGSHNAPVGHLSALRRSIAVVDWITLRARQQAGLGCYHLLPITERASWLLTGN
jgi:hypothetical protein